MSISSIEYIAATNPGTHTSMAPLSQTARALSRMPKEYLTFRLGGEEYGIDILRV